MKTLRKIRIGMVGGGPGAFIGAVHLRAMALTGSFELVCGAFSSDPEKSKARGAELRLPTERVYDSWKEMLDMEAKLPKGERMDAVVIVTPNHLHFDVALAAIKRAFHVICDKPATHRLEDVLALEQRWQQVCAERFDRGREEPIFCITHNYTGYPMVRQARSIIASGELGKVRAIRARYLQGWLATSLEHTGQKQADWRTDPERSGAAGAIGDIGVHAYNLMRFICPKLEVNELCADLRTAVRDRRLDDNASIWLDLGVEDQVHASIEVSQVAVGHENDLEIEIDCERGGLSWRQEEPNSLYVHRLDGPSRIERASAGYLHESALKSCMLPPGHTEGFLESFANIYVAFSQQFHGNTDNGGLASLMPSMAEAVEGMRFIAACVQSSDSGLSWVNPSTLVSDTE
ncbi:MAG: hypothetical protein RL150_304 [Candidatus Parcubacteria bacterium]|jgi:predicted dehydrogenase